MRLIKFTHNCDYGHDWYVQVLFTKQWALLQVSIHWYECPVWPFLQIQFGMGNLISILFSVYKFGLNIGLLERTWRL